MRIDQALHQMGAALPRGDAGGARFTPVSPVDGRAMPTLHEDTRSSLDAKIDLARECYVRLSQVPAPVRGECMRHFAKLLRRHKEALASLVTWESGKILQEALGEVQEMIDICDFAVGLSRQVGGRTLPSERSEHRMMEQWHPLGPIGVISAFNFPVAVWAWNAALAIVCGDPIVWKPSPQAPLSAWASHTLLLRAASKVDAMPKGISQVVFGGKELGEQLTNDRRLPLISATGSTEMGRAVGQQVAARLGRSLLELGGNNALVVAPSADLDLAIMAIVFSAVGTAGQRCTSLRRLIVHRSLKDQVVTRLRRAYESLRIGNPFDAEIHVGPIVGEGAAQKMRESISMAEAEGGILLVGGQRISVGQGGVYVRPALIEMAAQTPVMMQECFAPLLYLLFYDDLEEAISLQNGVPQGLSSALFTRDAQESEIFLSAAGSDCGIANINIGTSGAEIGGAFGGEKDTGGGRESGSDAWKSYMRRATNTINYGKALPLAQGIEFKI